MQASWDDISGSSSGRPGKHYDYKDPTSSSPGRIDSETLAGISRHSVDLAQQAALQTSAGIAQRMGVTL